MASSVDTPLNEFPINSVASDEVLKQMEDAGQLEANQIYMTPDEGIGELLYNGAMGASSTSIDLSAFDLGEGTYDMQIMGTCVSSGDTFIRVNNDSSSTYSYIAMNNYNATSPTGTYENNATRFQAGGIWNDRAFYNITFTVHPENVLTFSLYGVGRYSGGSTMYNRMYHGMKTNLAGGKLKSIQYGIWGGTATIYAYIKIYKRY